MLYIKTLDTDSPNARHEGGTELLKSALLEEYGLEIEASDILRGEHGKPYINENGVHFSISHCKDRAAVLLSPYPCGVDIERIRPINPAVISRVCTEKEKAFIGDSARRFALIWTLKESYVKAIGRGLGLGLKNVEFTVNGDKITSNLGGEFKTMELDDFIVSYCIKKD